MWVRNGLQIKGQAMTYVQSHFCNSMIDPDIYLLQVGLYVLGLHLLYINGYYSLANVYVFFKTGLCF